jgi:hypothetical protein
VDDGGRRQIPCVTGFLGLLCPMYDSDGDALGRLRRRQVLRVAIPIGR